MDKLDRNPHPELGHWVLVLGKGFARLATDKDNDRQQSLEQQFVRGLMAPVELARNVGEP